MFQTKLDRWLIKNFVYEHHILVMQLPSKLPFGVKKRKLPANNRNGYTHRLEIKNPKKANRVIESRREKGLSFKTQVVEKRHWYNWLINNKRKSFTFRVFWWTTSCILLFYGTLRALEFSKTEKFADIKKQYEKVLAPSKRK